MRFKKRKLKRLSFKRKQRLQNKLARIAQKRIIREKLEAKKLEGKENVETKKLDVKEKVEAKNLSFKEKLEKKKLEVQKMTRARVKLIKRQKRCKRTKVRRKRIRKLKLRRKKRRKSWAKIKLIRRRRRLLKKKRLPLMVKFMLKRIIYKHPIKLTFDEKLARCNPMKISDRNFARGYRSKRAKRHRALLTKLRNLEKKYENKYIAPFRYLRLQCKIIGYRKNIHERRRYESISDIKDYIYTGSRDNIMMGVHRDVSCAYAREKRIPRRNGLVNYDFLPFLD